MSLKPFPLAITLKLENVLIYTSHGGNKRSIHIVLNKLAHTDHTEAKLFYNEVCKEITIYTKAIYTKDKYLDFIDPAVYKSNQQFRVLGSQKVGSGLSRTQDALLHIA